MKKALIAGAVAAVLGGLVWLERTLKFTETATLQFELDDERGRLKGADFRARIVSSPSAHYSGRGRAALGAWDEDTRKRLTGGLSDNISVGERYRVSLSSLPLPAPYALCAKPLFPLDERLTQAVFVFDGSAETFPVPANGWSVVCFMPAKPIVPGAKEPVMPSHMLFLNANDQALASEVFGSIREISKKTAEALPDAFGGKPPGALFISRDMPFGAMKVRYFRYLVQPGSNGGLVYADYYQFSLPGQEPLAAGIGVVYPEARMNEAAGTVLNFLARIALQGQAVTVNAGTSKTP